MRLGKRTVEFLSTWILIGVALDAAALTGIWLLLNVVGRWPAMMLYWLEIVGLLSVPWAVHIVALPALFRVVPRIETVKLAALTYLYIGVAGLMLFPLLGYFIFLLIVFVVFMITTVTLQAPKLIDFGWSIVWTTTATAMGAIVGLLLHVMSKSSSRPTDGFMRSTRSDVLGGAFAGFLSFSGIFVASALGAFTQRVAGQTVSDLSVAVVPPLSTTLIIAVVALSPHLIMAGCDTLRVAAAEGSE
jgi:hypothetical protein